MPNMLKKISVHNSRVTAQALSDLGLKCDPQKLRVDIAYDPHPSNWINAVWAEFLKKQLNL